MSPATTMLVRLRPPPSPRVALRLLSLSLGWLARQYGACLELMSGLMALLCAAWWGVLYPHGFGQIPTYRLMAAIAPERAWATVMLVLGSVQLFAVTRDHDQLRDRSALAACSVWAFLATLYLTAAPTSVAGPTYALYAATQAWAYWRPTNPPPPR